MYRGGRPKAAFQVGPHLSVFSDMFILIVQKDLFKSAIFDLLNEKLSLFPIEFFSGSVSFFVLFIVLLNV